MMQTEGPYNPTASGRLASTWKIEHPRPFENLPPSRSFVRGGGGELVGSAFCFQMSNVVSSCRRVVVVAEGQPSVRLGKPQVSQ
jgi:hypothetical protein